MNYMIQPQNKLEYINVMHRLFDLGIYWYNEDNNNQDIKIEQWHEMHTNVILEINGDSIIYHNYHDLEEEEIITGAYFLANEPTLQEQQIIEYSKCPNCNRHAHITLENNIYMLQCIGTGTKTGTKYACGWKDTLTKAAKRWKDHFRYDLPRSDKKLEDETKPAIPKTTEQPAT